MRDMEMTRINFVLQKKQEACNRLFDALELLATCSQYVPSAVKLRILEAFQNYEKLDKYNLDYGDTKEGGLYIRRIQ
jgi:hypothetical protein